MKKSAKHKKDEVDNIVEDMSELQGKLVKVLNDYSMDCGIASLVTLMGSFCSLQDNPAEAYKGVIKSLYVAIELLEKPIKDFQELVRSGKEK